MAKLEEGFDLGLTVDGPKGPKFRVKAGPLEISKLSGVPVVPAAVGSKSQWVFRSWDAFEFPKPFTKVSVRFGTPVSVPADADPDLLEEKRLELENTLREITELNDRDVRQH